jgi:hypothetical protein
MKVTCKKSKRNPFVDVCIGVTRVTLRSSRSKTLDEMDGLRKLHADKYEDEDDEISAPYAPCIQQYIIDPTGSNLSF